jgi:hypothetical protein
VIEITGIERQLPRSSAKAFVARDSLDRLWVVRLKKTDKNAKRLVSEFLAGNLARLIGLRRPAVELVHLSGEVASTLDSSVFSCEEQFGVGVEFLDSITRVDPPPFRAEADRTFAELNREHLSTFCEVEDNLDQLYGYFVVTNWLQIEDTHKYENLFTDEHRRFLFLDMDGAFGGWEFTSSLSIREFYQIQKPISFLDGIVTDFDSCRPWLTKIESLASEDFLELASALEGKLPFPEKWPAEVANEIFCADGRLGRAIAGAFQYWRDFE